jgi:hypothetical protein
MKLLQKLKQIGLDFSNLREISILKLSVNIDRSIHVDSANSSVTINPKLLNGKQRRALKRVIASEALDEFGAIVHESALPTVDEARKMLPTIHETTTYFRPVLPAEDLPLLSACLFLRKQFEAGNSVAELKAQIVRVYGVRGRNLANLCSAGYLDEWFRPLYDELRMSHTDRPDVVREKFQAIYNAVLNELPWTEFVSAMTSKAGVGDHIVQKLERNAKNGVRFLNIHGLGDANVKKILAVLPDVQKRIGVAPARIEQERNRIFVRIELPAASST